MTTEPSADRAPRRHVRLREGDRAWTACSAFDLVGRRKGRRWPCAAVRVGEDDGAARDGGLLVPSSGVVESGRGRALLPGRRALDAASAQAASGTSSRAPTCCPPSPPTRRRLRRMRPYAVPDRRDSAGRAAALSSGWEAKADGLPAELSGGEFQRVALARARRPAGPGAALLTSRSRASRCGRR